MEIDITEFFNNAAPCDYSASQMELGKDAGKITWAHALEAAPDYNHLDTGEKLAAYRDDLREYGAWEDAEIDSWSAVELNALFLQEIASNMREGKLDEGEPDWDAYTARSEAGQCSGRIYRGDDGKIWFYVGM